MIRPTPARPALAFVFIAIGMSLAISAALRDQLPSIPAIVSLITAALLALGASFGAPNWRKVALAAAAIAFGLGWATLRTTHAPNDFLGARIDAATPPIITIEGVITTPPEIGPAQRTGALARFAPPITVTRFRLNTSAIINSDNIPSHASGSFHVRINEPADTWRIGDRVQITGRALPVSAPTNPGESDYRPYAIQNRNAGMLLVPTAGLIQPATTEPPSLHAPHAAFLRIRASTRGFIRDWIGSTTEQTSARALLGALLLGERTNDTQELQGAFNRIGLAHLLSISGLHLVAVAWGALMLLRLLGDRPRLETCIVLIAVVGYCFIAPVRTPIARAAIMVIAFLAAELAGRRYHPLAVLALTAIVIIIWKPTELASIGFQLSFGIVAALIALTPRVEQRFFQYDPPPDERTTGQFIEQHIRRLTIAALVAWAIATPLIAHHVGVISPMAPILTVLLAPPVTILLTGALAALLISAAIPPLAAVTGALLALLAGVITTIALFADSLPLSVIHVPHVSALWAVGATLVIGWWCAVGDRKNTPALIATIIMIGWTTIAFLPPRPDSNVALRVDSLDVGNGSCILVRSGSESILIDAGSSHFGAGQRTIPRALRALGAGRIDSAIITHANLDHYNALIDAADQIGLRRVLVTASFLEQATADPEGPVAALLEALRSAEIRTEVISAGDTILLGAMTAQILSPPIPSPFDEANNNSLVVNFWIYTYTGERSILITGDIEHNAMDRLFAQHPDLRADIAEAPHHGSAVTGAAEFLLRINPQVVLQSTGPSRLNDPRLDEARQGRTWLTTASDGAVWASILQDGTIDSGSFIQQDRRSSPMR